MVGVSSVCWACPVVDVAECQLRCDNGNGGACEIRAIQARAGWGLEEPDERLAQAFEEQGCKRGSPWACVKVAICHLKGGKCPPDPVRALTILKEECDAGIALACAAYGQVKIEAGEASAGFAYAEHACVGLDDAAGCRFLRKLCAEYPENAPVRCVDTARERACGLGDERACAGDLGEARTYLPISR